MLEPQARGVVYVAIGDSYLEEARQSASSLKAIHPNLLITLFSSTSVSASCFNEFILIEHPQPTHLDKLYGIVRSPYERTLFLDTDTYICGEIDSVFDLLDRFDLAASQAPIRFRESSVPVEYWKDVPESFAEFNSGVIAVRKSPSVQRMLEDWLARYNEYLKQERIRGSKRVTDQPSFRQVLYLSGLRIATLTAEYNCRFTNIGYPGMLGYVDGPVRILHGRHHDLPGIARAINTQTGPRTHILRNGRLEVQPAISREQLARREPRIREIRSRIGRQVRRIGAVARTLTSRLNEHSVGS